MKYETVQHNQLSSFCSESFIRENNFDFTIDDEDNEWGGKEEDSHLNIPFHRGSVLAELKSR